MKNSTLPQALRDHLEKVHAFTVISRMGSLRQAAVALRRTQPSLSRSVQILEQALGQKLLERSSSGVHPTPAGRMLLELGDRISAELDRVGHRLSSRSQGLSARLLIGSYESLAIRLWPRLSRELARMHPGLTLTLKTDCESDRMLRMVRSSQLDLALTIAPPPLSGLVHRPIYREMHALYASPALIRKSFAQRARKLSLEELRKVPFILVPNATYGERQTLETLVRKTGLVTDQLVYELDSFEAAKEFVSEGIGVGLLPRWLTTHAVSAGKLVELRVPALGTQPLGPHTFHATFRTSDLGDESVLAIVREAEKLFKQTI